MLLRMCTRPPTLANCAVIKSCATVGAVENNAARPECNCYLGTMLTEDYVAISMLRELQERRLSPAAGISSAGHNWSHQFGIYLV